MRLLIGILISIIIFLIFYISNFQHEKNGFVGLVLLMTFFCSLVVGLGAYEQGFYDGKGKK